MAVLPDSTDDAVEERARSYMESGQLPGYDDADIEITHDNDIDTGGTMATASQVTISYPFSFIVLQPVASLVVPGTSLGSPIIMAASAMMRNE